jgi:hypothetical protein
LINKTINWEETTESEIETISWEEKQKQNYQM